MVFLIDRQQGVDAEHLLRSVVGIPEVHQDDLGLHLGEGLALTVDVVHHDVGEGSLGGVLQLVVDLHEMLAAGRFLIEGLDIAGVGIGGRERIRTAADQQGVGGLREHVALAQALEEHRHGGQRVRVLEHVADAVAVVLHIELGHLGGRLGIVGQGQQEVGVGLVHLGQLGGSFGTGDRVAAEGVGFDDGGLALLEQQRGHARVAIEEVDEFRVAGGHLHVVAEGTVRGGLDGVKILVYIYIQLLDDQLLVGGTGEGAADVGLVRAGSQGERRKREREEFIAIFHTRRESLRRSAPFVPG